MKWIDTQLIYHALARKNRESLVITSTREPYACIGFAQDLKRELDLDYLREHNIGYFRRETGGGTVYLDGNQIFYQVIVRRDNPLTPRLTEAFFRKFLEPAVRTLNGLGLTGKFVPINDLIVGERKISGNGGGEIGDCKVLVGNLLLDFDFETMAKILNVPGEEFRKRIKKSMKKNITTLKSELGSMPNITDVGEALLAEYEKLLGPLTPEKVDQELKELMMELKQTFSTEKWLFQKVPGREGRDVKIKEGLVILHRTVTLGDYKIEMVFEIAGDMIRDVEVMKTSNMNIESNTLRENLVGVTFGEKQVLNIIKELHQK